MQWVWVVSPSTCFFLIGFCVRWEKTNVSHCVSAAVTWTTVRRLRFQRTTSTRARRTSDPSVSTCWGFWAKVDMERCTVHTLSQSHCRVYYAACLFVYIFIKFLFQVFQVRKVAGAASGTIFAMKVLKKVINYFSSCCFFFFSRMKTVVLLWKYWSSSEQHWAKVSLRICSWLFILVYYYSSVSLLAPG